MDISNNLIILISVIVILYFWYVSIVGKKNQALEAFSTIDVQLKQRSDLIPNVLKIASKFMKHEKELLTQITDLRTQATKAKSPTDAKSVKEKINIENQLSDKMSQLMVNVENYPDLKSNTNMLKAQDTYSEVEANIAAARRFYNSAVTSLNNSIMIFPGNIIGSIAGVTKMPYIKASEAEKKPVKADDYLK